MLPICFLFSFGAMHICKEWGVRVCGNVVLGSFWCGVAVIFISSTLLRFSESKRCAVSLNFMSLWSVKKKIFVSRSSASFS